MSTFYDTSAGKRATSVTVNEDLLRQAKELGINLSGTLEARLVELVAEQRRAQWLAENADAIEGYNDRVARDGVFSDGLRRF